MLKNIRTIKTNINELEGFHDLIRAYQEIASIRMKKSRTSVLSSREFMESINEIFEEVRRSYAEKTRQLLRRRSQTQAITFLAHNSKTVAVLISSNTGLYGQIVPSTFEMFLNEIRASDSEVTIIGRHGLSLFLKLLPDHPYTFFELSDANVAPSDLDIIIRHIVQYEEIRIFYGRFLNIVSQEPATFNIMANIKLSDEDIGPQVPYIFEPSLETILQFFETEIFASMFEQIVREGELAKNASRVISMDQADINIKLKIKNLKLIALRSRHEKANKKQLAALAHLNQFI
ncbi:hypothetical protein A2382_02030 [Candidatus Woesebacteria bacterium RIFOXYB1_FULL_38_16]|uniref:ATP synthase gamma chain n=1 Tax=Candidatus Woesebacteria bacterium RIFOXYB1_FULL_38_16 TaxID=1802538 RepID=A0A1F8CTM1_9BACT|nr:MAG: hypothetical protein A2191_04860 [Candidatus Woesebacteria bacterium RIFOXYA1_FULL_38_9]OGM79677.1 MAG: hypothetical protein A2382_02030 [Candidatus Woesebacteria bacterium RIFOXYB1_FULL_38_16]